MPERPSGPELLAAFLGTFTELEFEFSAALGDETFRGRTREFIADDAEILFEVPSGGFVGEMAGPWIGPDGYLAGWAEWLSSWDEFRVEVEEILECGNDAVLLLVMNRARPKGSPAVLEQPAAALYRIDGGKFVRIEHFLDQAQARQAAGLEDGQ